MDLDLKSKACDKKCNLLKIPGQHGIDRSRPTGYAIQFREKQKVKRIYGLREHQVHGYYKQASLKKGNSGETLLQLLESRLDNTLYRMGFASTRSEARQIVCHKLVLVNDKVCNIPSLILQPNDVVSIREKARTHTRIMAAIESSKSVQGFPWLVVDLDKFTGTFFEKPERASLAQDINEHLIIELYSR